MKTMPGTSIRLYTFYLPLADYLGRPFPGDQLARACHLVVNSIGGCTVLPNGVGPGVTPDGQCYTAPVVGIQAFGSDDPMTTIVVEALARELAAIFNDVAIFVTWFPAGALAAIGSDTSVEATGAPVSWTSAPQRRPQ